jgi:uncharacterized membrane protein
MEIGLKSAAYPSTVLDERRRSPRHVAATIGGLMLIGLVLLVPDMARRTDLGLEPVTAFRGRIVQIQPAPSDPNLPPVPVAQVLALDGDQAGQTIEAYLSGPGGSQVVAGYRPGDEVVVTITQIGDGSPPFVAVSDRWRIPSLQVLGVLFAAVVLVVGGWRGARALIALGLTIAIILKVLLPLLINGVAPLPLAVFVASGVTVVTIVLTEGWRRSSLAAILGTTGALALTGLLGAAATGVMGFTYTAGSDLAFLTTSGGTGLDLRGLLLAAMILGAVGVLDDVTVTQAVLVDELAEKGRLRSRDLFLSAMGVGRSHIGATINTLFLAYVGAGLPLLVVLLVSRQPAALVLNDEVITTEIVRTLVGSIGIVAAVPFTTFIAALLASSARPDPVTGAADQRPSVVLAIGLAVAALLTATTLLPLTSGATVPLTPPVFEPGTSFPSGSGEPGAADGSESAIPDEPSPPDEPQIVERGDPLPITVDGEQVGTVTVVRWTTTSEPPPRVGERIRVSLEYEATETLDLAAVTWELLLGDGTEIVLDTEGSASADGTLMAGQRRDVILAGEFPNTEETPFLVYLDAATGSYPYALPIG